MGGDDRLGCRSCLLYDALARHDTPPWCLLPHQAVARGPAGRGPTPRSPRLDGLADALASYHLFHAAGAELLTMLGSHDEAREANRTALGLTCERRRALACSPTRLHPASAGGRVVGQLSPTAVTSTCEVGG